jgi:5-formyltetrahydrofolate cyclo-ligase
MLIGWRKSRARKTAKAARNAAHAALPDAGRRLVEHFPDEIWPAVNAVVAGYRPIHDEIDPTPLVETFHCEQARLALPCVTGAGEPLIFRSWAPGQTLAPGAFKVDEPEASAPEVRPQLILAPMLGFDHRGRRLGYGAGFYDRTIRRLRDAGPVTVVGLAFSAQRLSETPTDRYDMPVDWVVTESGALRCGPRGRQKL